MKTLLLRRSIPNYFLLILIITIIILLVQAFLTISNDRILIDIVEDQQNTIRQYENILFNNNSKGLVY